MCGNDDFLKEKEKHRSNFNFPARGRVLSGAKFRDTHFNLLPKRDFARVVPRFA